MDFIEENIKNGSLSPIDANVSKAFYVYLERNYPLVPYTFDTVDWEKVSCALKSKVDDLQPDAIKVLIQRMTLSRFSHVLTVYRRKSSAFISTYQFFLEYFDDFVNVPHTCYFIGADVRGSTFQYFFDHFIEWELDEGQYIGGKLTCEE